MPTLRQLRYLEAIDRFRHFGRAAEHSSVTQSALSQQIMALEAELGARLVDRAPGRIELTAIGREVVGRARGVLDGVRDLVDAARRPPVPLSGPLRLGVIPSIAPYVLPRVLPVLAGRHPALRLEVRETITDTLAAELAAGDLDCILVALPIGDPRLGEHPLFDDPFLLAVNSGAAWLADGLTPAEIVREAPLLLLEEGHCLRDQALTFCATLRPDLRARFGASSLTTIVHLVAGGHGVTLLPKMCADSSPLDPRVRLIAFPPPAPKREVGLVWRSSSPREPDFRALGEAFCDAMASGPGEG
jgi:LysR family hydrogen peroxide-inducible transcriptional activator